MTGQTAIRWVVFVLGAIGIAQPMLAASPSAEEERLLKKGVKLREAGDERHAVVELQQAYDLARSPKAAGQLGLSEWALGRWVEAESHVTEALKATNDPFLRDKQRRQVLEQALNTIQGHLGTLEIAGEPTGAEVVVAGKIVGRFPLAESLRACAGPVDIEVSADGYESDKRTITLSAGQYQRILVRLKRTGVATSAVNPPVATPNASPTAVTINVLPAQVATSPDRSQTLGQTTTPENKSPIRWRSVAKWSALGGAVGMLGLGIGANVYHKDQYNKFTVSCEQAGKNQKGEVIVSHKIGFSLTDDACMQFWDNSANAKTASIVGYVSAGVLAAAWLTLWLTEPSPKVEAGTVAWSCAPTIGGIGMACAFRY